MHRTHAADPVRQYDFFIEPTWTMGVAVNDRDLSFDDGDALDANPLQITGLVIHVGGSFDLHRAKRD